MKIGTGEPLGLYEFDKNVLLQHGVVLGSTGSGKTGLGIRLLESLALEGIPIIAIDPKGDLGNIVDVQLRYTAVKGGWAWDDKLVQLASVDATIYTPGVADGRGGVPLSIYGPKSHTNWSYYIAAILERIYGQWIPSHDPRFVHLERVVQLQKSLDPKFIMETETNFLTYSERTNLARKVDALNSSQEFKRWGNGRTCNVESELLWNMAAGRTPRLSIISLAHMSDAERQWYLPLLLAEIVETMRGWRGTEQLRAVLYVDEAFGLLPPVANPASKQYLLALLKQARAYGLGVVLATQNPADLDYRALSNVGNWWVGTLRTQRDRDRVGEALGAVGVGADNESLGILLGSLEKRQFVQATWGRAKPVVVRTDDCLCKLSGPLTLEQIRERMAWRQPDHPWKFDADQIGMNATLRRLRVWAAKLASLSLDQEMRVLGAIKNRKARSFSGEAKNESPAKFFWGKVIKPIFKKRQRAVMHDVLLSFGGAHEKPARGLTTSLAGSK